MWGSDAVGTSSEGPTYGSGVLRVLSAETTLDYAVTLDSFAAGSFTITSSNGTNINGDILHYVVIECDDAEAVRTDFTALTSPINVSVSFAPDCVFTLCAPLAAASIDTQPGAGLASVGFGVQSNGAAAGMSFAVTRSDGDTMTTSMNYNTNLSGACITRLDYNADTVDGNYDVTAWGTTTTFTAGGGQTFAQTVGVVTLFLKGVSIEYTNAAKQAGTGVQSFAVANSLLPKGLLCWMTGQTASGTRTGNASFCIGATDGTRQGFGGTTAPEAVSTTEDHIQGADATIEELTGGASPAETSIGTFSAFSAGSASLNWTTNGGSAALLYYIALGDFVRSYPENYKFVDVGNGMSCTEKIK